MGTTDAPPATPDRVVVFAPLGRDAAVVCHALGTGDIACVTAGDMADVVAAVRRGDTAALLVTEEALTIDGAGDLCAALAGQPSWSDLPVLLLTAADATARDRVRFVAALRAAGNLTLVVRPVPTVALVTAATAALRARLRQYEVRDLIAAEHAARTAAEQANRTKEEFLATVSHELRTPLSAILLWAGMIGMGGMDPADLAAAVAAIRSSAASQSRLIEDLLDASRIRAGGLRLNLHDVDLAPVAARAVAVVRPIADAKQVQLYVALDPAAGVARADPERVQQLIWNLLSNAIKFTPTGGRVSIALCRDGDHVRLGVSDSGQGIAPEFLPHVFERFRQADATPARRHGGLGLGLAITQQLVQLHGGSITAESDGPGKGAAFTVRLPLKADAPPGPAHSQPLPAQTGA